MLDQSSSASLPVVRGCVQATLLPHSCMVVRCGRVPLWAQHTGLHGAQVVGSTIAVSLLTRNAVPLQAQHAGMHGAQVVGSAIAISLLTYNAVPLWAGVVITAVASFLLLLLEQAGVRFLEAVFAVLIGTMAVSFGIMYVLAGVPTAKVVEGGPRVLVSGFQGL